MIPLGGISLLVHAVINLYCNVIKKYPMKALSFFIILSSAALIVHSGQSQVKEGFRTGSNTQLIREMFHPCVPIRPIASPDRVILRLDDVQAFAYAEITEKLISDASANKMRLTLGVIPHQFDEDQVIQKIIKRNKCNLELALHGWDHSMNSDGTKFEFEQISHDDAKSKIFKGKELLEKTSDVPVVTFIPPGNEVSEDTQHILQSAGITYLSADHSSSEYGMSATTYDFPNKTLVSNDEILKRCDEKFSQNKLCVIVLHPQDYMTDGKVDPLKYQYYLNLLSDLNKKQVASLTFSDLHR